MRFPNPEHRLSVEGFDPNWVPWEHGSRELRGVCICGWTGTTTDDTDLIEREGAEHYRAVSEGQDGS